MAKAYTLQTAFNSGVLDTRLSARVDVKQYYNGMAQGENILCLPQGGVRRRPGMEFIASNTTNYSRVVPFVFNVDQSYLLVFRNNAIDIYRDDVFKVTVVTTYTTAELMDIRFTQSADTMIIVHENHAPALLQRLGSDTSWSLANISFDYIPQYDFNDASSPTPTDEIQVITFATVGTGSPFKLNLEGVDTESISYQDNASGAQDIEDALLDLVNTPNTDISVSRTAANTFTVTFTGSAADDWGQMSGRVTDGSGGTITVSTTQDGVSRAEDTWSATRGWPKTVTFHEGRLFFGGSTQRPITFWGSRVNDFFNFDLGKSRDDQALDVTLDVEQFDEIRSIFSNRHLQIFTAGAEFYISSSPITPENIAARRQTGFGAAFIQPKVIDGATIYLQRTGRSLREFVYDFAEEAYLSSTASLLAPELLTTPVDLAVSVGTDNEDANYVYVVNSDGTMAVFNTLRAQNVAGWSYWTTDGEVQNICRLVDSIYLTVKRGTNYVIEKLNDDALTDSAVLYTSPATNTLTGLSHLDGVECKVIADGSVLGNETPASGSVTIDRVATNSAEVGLFFRPTVKTMPIEKDIGPGYNLMTEKRIVRAMVYMQNTTNLKVQDVLLPFRNFGTGILDQAPTEFTGKKEVYLLGWTKTAQVTITQDEPGPMTVLGLSLEMEFS